MDSSILMIGFNSIAAKTGFRPKRLQSKKGKTIN